MLAKWQGERRVLSHNFFSQVRPFHAISPISLVDRSLPAISSTFLSIDNKVLLDKRMLSETKEFLHF